MASCRPLRTSTGLIRLLFTLYYSVNIHLLLGQAHARSGRARLRAGSVGLNRGSRRTARGRGFRDAVLPGPGLRCRGRKEF